MRTTTHTTEERILIGRLTEQRQLFMWAIVEDYNKCYEDSFCIMYYLPILGTKLTWFRFQYFTKISK